MQDRRDNGRDDGLELKPEVVQVGVALAYRPADDPFLRPEYEPEEAEESG